MTYRIVLTHKMFNTALLFSEYPTTDTIERAILNAPRGGAFKQVKWMYPGAKHRLDMPKPDQPVQWLLGSLVVRASLEILTSKDTVDRELQRDIQRLGFAKPKYPAHRPPITGKAIPLASKDDYLAGPMNRDRYVPHVETVIQYCPIVCEDIQMVLDDLYNWGDRRVTQFVSGLKITLVDVSRRDPLFISESPNLLKLNYHRFRLMDFEPRYNAICDWVSQQLGFKK